MSGSGKTPGQAAHPLDLAAIAAWTAFYDIDPETAVRDWPGITPGTREKWRAAVDAALMAAEAQSLDQVAQPAPELAAAMGESRKMRDVVCKLLDLFGKPDDRRMRHASVTAATLDRYAAEAGVKP